MNTLIFCDEFGNTGGNLQDPEQPVLLYAFVVLSSAAYSTISDKVTRLTEESASSPSELKSSRLLKSSRGRKRLQEIGLRLVEQGAWVCLSIVEKRYQACSMIAETYLDPQLHKFAPAEMRERSFRQRFADACYTSLSDERVFAFLSAVDRDDPEELAVFGQRFCESLRLHPDPFVAMAATRIETRAEHVFRYGQPREGFPKNANIPASQFFAFHPGLDSVEACLRARGETGQLLRDEDPHFGEVLNAAFAAGQEIDSRPGAKAYGAQFQLDSISRCDSASSATALGIQLADLAAGLFGRMTRDICLRRPPSAELYRTAETWRPLLQDVERHHLMVSDATLEKLAPALFGSGFKRLA